ncbi:MAG: sulfatase-like hydrolase/transferase [Bryobacterales bacterium]|nr:sulfatase-like hydrolase/transferase [Bryobacterales bacterium]
MLRREFLQTAAGVMTAAPRGAKRPNVMIILADDMGFSDAGCYGGEIDTPNLDSLAARGLRFTNGYSTARCGPSRSSILTGYYAQQTASDVMTPGNIPAYTRFFPQYMKPLGYRTYHSGKWHIRFHPLARTGFDHSYTLLDQNRFFTPKAHLLDDQPLPPPKPSDGFYGTIAIADHAVDFLKQHQREHARDPFFFYLAFTSPHFPLQALQQDIDLYKDRFAEGWDVSRARRHERLRRMGIVNCGLSKLEPGIFPPWNTKADDQLRQIGPGEVHNAVPWTSLTDEQRRFQRTKMAIHAAMITRMDREIGRVLAQLKAMRSFDDTLIFFVSDNGASAEIMIRADGHDPAAPPGSARSHLCLGPGWSSAANSPFRLHKSWVHEGGIASPWIAHWPNGIKDHGKLRHDACHFIDFLPTALEVAGSNAAAAKPDGAPTMPGRSLVPALGKGRVTRDYLYFHHNRNRAIRQGDWKLASIGAEGPWELYNLADDRAEQVNLAQQEPQKTSAMASLWQQTEDTFVKTREAAAPAKWEQLKPAS